MKRTFETSHLWGCLLAAGLLTAIQSGSPAAKPASTPAAAPKPAKAAAGVPLPTVALPDVTLPAINGGQAKLTALAGNRGTVLVFLSPECPISNGYVPALNRLAASYRERQIAVVGLHSNTGHSLRELAAHRREYEIAFPVLRDAGGEVAAGLGAKTCPAVCVFDARGGLCYQGRIDDRYTKRGTASGTVRTKDLEAALDELLAGEPITRPATEPIGCPIRFPEQAKADLAAEVTFNHQIVRILQDKCQSCHRPDGVGPFALITYKQATAWADDIQQLTANGTMPPWKPAPGHGEFDNERRLLEEEIEQIARWVAKNCPEGNPQDLPQPRAFKNGWVLGEPDLVLTASDGYHLAADGPDEYRLFVLPTNFDGDRYVKATEVLPGNARVVHHVIAFLDTSGRSDQLDAADPQPGYKGTQGFPGFLPSGGLGGWAPGNTADFLPPGMVKVLPKGARVVIQVHYHRTGKEEVDQTRIGLHFAKEPPDRAVRTIPVLPASGRFNMRIPAGDANFEVTASQVLSRDLLAIAVTPHMHLLGKDMKMTATLPDGAVVPLIYVRNWDFNWQESYQYRQPIALPKGTRIDLVAHFDNSAANPHNPSSPPQLVRWGEQTTDEMCIGFLEVAPQARAASPSDVKAPNPGAELLELLKGEFTRRVRLTENTGSGVTHR